MGWSDEHSIRPVFFRAVPAKNGMRYDGRRRVTKPALIPNLNASCGEDFDCCAQRRFGEGVRIHSQEERTFDPIGDAMFRDSLTDGRDMVLVKCPRKG